jgi:hypothetical protein
MALLSNSVVASSVGRPCRFDVDPKLLQQLQHPVRFLGILSKAALRFAVVAIGVEGFGWGRVDRVLSDEPFSRAATIFFYSV